MCRSLTCLVGTVAGANQGAPLYYGKRRREKERRVGRKQQNRAVCGLRKEAPLFFFLTRPNLPAVALYAVPLVFGLVALLTKNPLIRTFVPLGIPLITFLSLAWWADRKETCALLVEMTNNADALLRTCRAFIEEDFPRWRENPTTVSLLPPIESLGWDTIMERTRSDASAILVARHHNKIAQIYMRLHDLPIMTGAIVRRASWSWDAFREPYPHDPHLPQNIFQCCLAYLALAETLRKFVADVRPHIATEAWREAALWTLRARVFLQGIDEAWDAYLSTHPDCDTTARGQAFDGRYCELLEAYAPRVVDRDAP